MDAAIGWCRLGRTDCGFKRAVPDRRTRRIGLGRSDQRHHADAASAPHGPGGL